MHPPRLAHYRQITRLRPRAALVVALACLLTFPFAASSQTVPGSRRELPFTVVKETTLLTEPLKPDGSVDYITAINRQSSQGVTPANNALVALLPAIGATKVTFGSRVDEFLKLAGPPGAKPQPGTWKRFAGNWHSQDEQLAAERAMAEAETALWNPVEHPDWSRFLDSNREALATFHAAAAMARFWMPTIPDDSGTLVSVLFMPHANSRQIEHALRLHAMRQPLDPAGAWKDLLAIERLGALVAQDSDIMSLLVAAAMERDALTTAQVLIAALKTDAALLQRMRDDLAALPPLPTVQEVYRRKAIYYYPDAIQHLALHFEDELAKSGTPSQVVALRQALADAGIAMPDWDRVLRFGNRWCTEVGADRRYASAAEYLKVGRDSDAQAEQLYKEAHAGEPADADPDHPGDYLFFPRKGDTKATYSDRIAAGMTGLLLPLMGKGEARVADAGKARQLTILACALELHYRDAGAYPDSLAALAPKYLASIPTDYYGKPLDYTHTSTAYHLASLGMENDTPEEAVIHRSRLTVDIKHDAK